MGRRTPEQKAKRRDDYRKNRVAILELRRLRYAERTEERKQRDALIRRQGYLRYRDTNKEQLKQKLLLEPTWRRASILRNKYNLTRDAYRAKLEAQQYACAICRKQFYGMSSRSINIDHDHATGIVRDVLCNQCNVMLGAAKDRPDLLEAGIEYLLRHGKAYTTEVDL